MCQFVSVCLSVCTKWDDIKISTVSLINHTACTLHVCVKCVNNVSHAFRLGADGNRERAPPAISLLPVAPHDWKEPQTGSANHSPLLSNWREGKLCCNFFCIVIFMNVLLSSIGFSTLGQRKVLFELFCGVRTSNDTVRQWRISRGNRSRKDQEAIGHLTRRY